jgi:hypothetical protein
VVQLSAFRIHRNPCWRCQIGRAMNVLRCHAGSTRIFFISGTNYSALCSELAGRAAAARVSACRASLRSAPHASNILKTIANLAHATLQAATPGFFPAGRALACVLHSVRGGGGQVV